MTDQLVLKVDGKQLSGWTEIAVTRGIEQLPNTFSISASEASPVASDAVMVQEGASCTVSLGSDVVLTGYVDTVAPSINAGGHAVTIMGRGKCEDLTDPSAEWPNGQISGANALAIAQKLAKPYGITANNLAAAGPTVPQFNITFGETPAEILDLVCRHAGLLWYEGADGNLILNQAGKDKAGSGFVEGQNIQAAALLKSMAGRFSDYACTMLAVNTSGVIENKNLFFFTAKDPAVKRHRLMYVVADQVIGGQDLAKKRALWEAARRAGRGKQVRLTADSWRDGAGKLWEPNTLAPVTIPRFKLKEAGLCIAEVTYRLGLDAGRTADLLLMPKEAFLPEPIVLQPQVPGLTPAEAKGTP